MLFNFAEHELEQNLGFRFVVINGVWQQVQIAGTGRRIVCDL